MYNGKKETSYRMMRYRVLFQVGTIAALVFGMYFRPTTAEDPTLGKGTVVDKRYFLDHAFAVKSKPVKAATEELK